MIEMLIFGAILWAVLIYCVLRVFVFTDDEDGEE